MNAIALQLKRVSSAALFILLMSIVGMTKAQNISFAEESVKALCVANWDTNNDGELSYAEAAAVTDLGTVFKSKSNITTFDELQYFTGLDTIGRYAFYDCFYLTSVVIPNTVTCIDSCAFYFCLRLPFIAIPSSVTSIGYGAFYYCQKLGSAIVKPETPPTLENNVFVNVNKFIPMYLSCSSSPAYQNAQGWNEFTNFIELCPGVISVAANNDGYGTVTGGGSFEGGDTCTVTANANAGYFFAYWSEDGVEVSNEDSYSFLVTGDRALVANFVANSNIVFTDDNVKAICVANWDTDGDGELSYAEADAVTDLGTVFRNKTNITTFDELQYFTGLTFIGNDAFRQCSNLTSVVLPSFVTYLGNNSFLRCSSLTELIIPNSVTAIRNYALSECSGLTAITIPNSVNTIWSDAFADCTGLTSLFIPKTVTSFGERALSGCDGLEQIVVEAGNPVYDSRNDCNAVIITNSNELHSGCKSTVIPNTVTSIGTSAFRNIGTLISIAIPNSVNYLNHNVFNGCSGLVSISIGNSVNYIGSNVFAGCTALEQITVAADNPVFDSRGNCNAIIKTSTNELVVGCKNTVIPNTVTAIGANAFYGCTSLLSITIPNSVTSFGNYAFYDCSGLTSIDIPNSVTSIGNGAFYKCTGFTSITIPSSVTSIGTEAFYYCSNLTSIFLWPETPPVMGSYVFGYVNNTIPLYVACGASPAYIIAEGWNTFHNYYEMCPGVITVTANVAAYGNVTGGGSFAGGEICTVTATPNEGYFFSYWSDSNGTGLSNEQTYSFPVTGSKTLVANFVPNGNIAFADANVKALCVANWDTNGDGELSYAEADLVTDLGTVFKYKTNVTTFDELQYFTGLTSIGYQAFYGCTELTSIVIPNTVTSIGQSAFSSCESLPTIVIPNSVTTIDKSAFSYCYDLVSVGIPNSLFTLGDDAFTSCRGLISLNLPKTLSSMGRGAFSNCNSLEQIVVDAENLVYDSRDNCNAIIKTSTNALIAGCMSTIIPNTVISIGESAFYGCTGLTSIVIPNSVTAIGNSAFSSCSGLTSVGIGNSLATLGSNVFSYCPALEQIIVASDNEVFDSRDNCNAIIKTATNELVVGCKGTVIPNTVTTIGQYAFYGSGLTLIDIPDSIISIGQYAFYYCRSLTSASIGNSVTTIGNYAFSNCTSLASISIGSSVTSLGNYALYSSYNLASMVIWAENPPTIGNNYTLSSINKTIPLYVPCGFSNAYQNAVGWCDFSNRYELCPGVITVTANNADYGNVTGGGLYQGGEICTVTATPNEGYFFAYWSENGGGVSNEETYSFIVAGDKTLVANFIPNGVITFADSIVKSICVANWDSNGDGELSYLEAHAVTDLGTVFRNNKNITAFDELQYFTGLTYITSYAFSGCTALTSVIIPNSVAQIRSYAFENCRALTSMDIPNSVVSLINGTFIRCSGLTSVTLPNSLHTIGDHALAYCGSLTTIDIPNSVISIERNAFALDTCLISITIPSSVTSIGDNPILGCSRLEQIVVEAGNTVYDSRNGCNAIIKTSTNTLIGGCMNTVIPNTVATIESAAFYGCTGLTAIDIPNSVTRIETSAFYGCTGLTSAIIPNSVTYLGSNMFYNCSNLVSVSIGNSVATIGSDIFNNCSALEQITVASDNVVFDSRDNCNAIIRTSTNELIAGCNNTTIPNTVTSIGNWALSFCRGLNSLDIPNSVTSIGNYAFYYCNALTSITVLAETPPTLGSSVFNGVPKTIPLYVPNGCYEVYHNAAGWNEFINIIEMYPFRFVTEGYWNKPSNWSGGVMPGPNDSASIHANCIFNKNNATVMALRITAGHTLTLQAGKTLTVTGTLTNTSATGLVIKDGAQLINASENVAATMEKDITAYNSSNSNGWYTISSPMNSATITGSGFVTNNYDLYRFNETSLNHKEWENHKVNLADFNAFENGRGYLYANDSTFSPSFTGTLNNTAVTYSLTYTERPDDPLSGFNLIGNPFPHDIYKGAGGAIDNANLVPGYYTLTNEGTWEVHDFEDAIQPGQGILVKATAPTNLTIAKSTEEAYSESGVVKTGTAMLRISIEGDDGHDRAFVYFGQGVGLDKVEDLGQNAPSLAIRNEQGDFAIAHFDKKSDVIELVFTTPNNGDATLKVKAINSDFDSLHLFDCSTGVDIDLLQQSSYTFSASAQAGERHFKLLYKQSEK